MRLMMILFSAQEKNSQFNIAASFCDEMYDYLCENDEKLSCFILVS